MNMRETIPWLFSASVMIVLALGGCDDPQREQSAAEPVPMPGNAEQPQVHPHNTKPQEQRETLKKNLRVIGDGHLPAPKLEGDSVARIAPGFSAEDRNALEKARIPKKPNIFALPVVQSSAVLVSGETMITLEGIKALEADAVCKSAEGEWPCGNFARAALQRLIRTRSLTCEGNWPKSGDFRGRCRVGNQDLATWVVEQGWASSASDTLQSAMAAAKAGQRGMWRR